MTLVEILEFSFIQHAFRAEDNPALITLQDVLVEKPKALTILRRNMINKLKI